MPDIPIAFTRSSTDRVEIPWMYASWTTAVSAFSERRRGGETNISLSSLDKLANALGVDFVAMIADPHADSRRIDAIGWRGKKLESVAKLLGSAPASREAQLWHWTLSGGETYQAEPDQVGWHEMVFVTEGCLTISKDDGTLTVPSGDFAIYSSAQRYAYRNLERSPVRFVRIVAS